jgi:hypothetical protein
MRCPFNSRSFAPLIPPHSQVVEVSARYDDACEELRGSDVLCSVRLTAPREMKAPIFVYYQIEGMYLNHRRMVLSRSDSQLRGADTVETETCAPQRYQGGNGAAARASGASRCGCGCAFALFLTLLLRRRELAHLSVRSGGVVVL